MKVLVTGSTGYLGGHVASHLLARGHDVRALVRPGSRSDWLEELGIVRFEGDLLDEASLHRAARGADGLVHCAARMGLWSRQDVEQRRVNVEGTATLLRAARRRGLERIVHVSTIAAVGCRRDPTPLTEKTPWAGSHRPRVMYIDSKREAEERALAGARAGLGLLVVNPAMMVGPRADGRTRGRPVAGTRRTRRRTPRGGSSVVDVEDVAEGCVLALERGQVGERYILGGHNMTWLELGAALAQRAGDAPPVGTYPPLVPAVLVRGTWLLDRLGLSRPTWAPDLFRTWGWYTCADSSKAQRDLGYRYRGLEETLARALEADPAGCGA